MENVLAPIDRVTLRIEPEVLERWKEKAKAERRSLSNWVMWMVEKIEDESQN